MRDLLSLPKADLHCHLEGSARPGTIQELAHNYGLQLGDSQDFNNLPEFLVKYEEARSVIRYIDDLERVATEFIEDCAESGAVYCEPDWVPHFYTYLDGLTGTTLDEKIEEIFTRVDAAMVKAAGANGIKFGHLLGVDKTKPAEAEEIARFAIAHRDRNVVSFGFAGNEVALPHEPMKAAAQIATAGGILFVPHAGETRGPESIEEVLELRPHRIAHGISAALDPGVMSKLISANIACDVALSSNVRLGVISDLGKHPLRQLVESGVPCTLNTDDSLFFGSSLLNEYEKARSLGLDDEQLADIAANSIRFSGAPQDWKDQNILKIREWLS